MDEKTILLLSSNNYTSKRIKRANTGDEKKGEDINLKEIDDLENSIRSDDIKHFKVNKKNDSDINSLITQNHLQCGLEGLAISSKLIRSIINNRVLPCDPLPESVIIMFISQLASLDTNNFVYKSHRIGAGEREGRVFSNLVKQRHYNFSHGVGRSGDLTAHQPKAAGSSLMYSITNALALSAIKTIVAIACFNLKNVVRKKYISCHDNSVDNCGKKIIKSCTSVDEKDVNQGDINKDSQSFIYSSLLSKITHPRSSLFEDALVVPLSTGMCLTLVLREIANQRNRSFFNRPAISDCIDAKTNSEARDTYKANNNNIDGNSNLINSVGVEFCNNKINLSSIQDVKSILPQYVIWSRIDQKTCLKCITAAGLTPVIVNLRRVPRVLSATDCQSTDDLVKTGSSLISESNSSQNCSFFVQCHPDDVLSAIKRTPGYPHSIIAVLTTTSCFAPRLPDPILSIARICHQFGIPHVVNNAYGLQSRYICRMIHNTSASNQGQERGSYNEGYSEENNNKGFKEKERAGDNNFDSCVINSSSTKNSIKKSSDGNKNIFNTTFNNKNAVDDINNVLADNFNKNKEANDNRLQARIDAFVQSTDKNFMVPVGGSVVVGNKAIIKAISALYPGRASASPIVDLFITLLSMGRRNYVDLAFTKRYELLPYFHDKIRVFAAERNESVVIDERNDISFGVTLQNAYKTIFKLDIIKDIKKIDRKKNPLFLKEFCLNEIEEVQDNNNKDINNGKIKNENIEALSVLRKEENDKYQHLQSLLPDKVIKSSLLITTSAIIDADNFSKNSSITHNSHLSNNNTIDSLLDNPGSDTFVKSINIRRIMNEAAISIGSKLYHMGVTGPKVVVPLIDNTNINNDIDVEKTVSKTISGIKFSSFGMHGADEVNNFNIISSSGDFATYLAPVSVPLLVMACAIGMEKHEVDMFVERLIKLYPIQCSLN